MLYAENMLYPKGQLQRFDMTGTQYGRYKKHNKYPIKRNKYPIKRSPFPKAWSRKQRYGKFKQKHKWQKEKRFLGKCHACSGAHQVRYCTDKMNIFCD